MSGIALSAAAWSIAVIARQGSHPPALQLILDAALGGDLSREQAEALHALGPEAVTLFALAMAQRVAGLRQAAAAPSPATPSGMAPPHLKPSTRASRRRKPGARQGHAGSHRKTPAKIDARVEHRLLACPC